MDPQRNYNKQSQLKKVIELGKGRIPPQAIDLEEAILGGMLIDKSCISEVLQMVSLEAFYKEEHQVIFTAIRDVFLDSGAVDHLGISRHLRSNGQLESIGGDYYLSDLTLKVSSTANIEFQCRILLQKFIQRQIIANCGILINKAFDEETDVFDLLDEAYSDLNEVSEILVKTQEAFLGELIDPQIEKARKIATGEIKPGIPTPIKRLTAKSGGWRETELIILAARPGMGKTGFALKAGLAASQSNNPVAFFSLEMSKEQITNRVISMMAKIEGDKFTMKGLSETEALHATRAMKEFRKLPFIIDDTAALSIEQFQIKAKRLVSRHKVKLIIVDYLQLMKGNSKSKGNREQEISAISRGLKLVAKELKVNVIALSQLSRAVEQRGGNKRPLLSDLRESGAIEQDADMVMFLYRPEYYDIHEWDDYKAEPTAGEAEYIVAKNRNGGLVRNRMKFEGPYTNFEDLEEAPIDYPPIQSKEHADFTPDNDEDDLPF